MKEVDEFIKNWEIDKLQCKDAFVELKNHLEKKEHLSFTFDERAGLTYSLRPKHENQKNRNLFVMVDVIDEDKEERWLSVCFYGDMITDPEELGDLIPEGLLGEDGYCFDYSEKNLEFLDYIKKRLDEAYEAARKESA